MESLAAEAQRYASTDYRKNASMTKQFVIRMTFAFSLTAVSFLIPAAAQLRTKVAKPQLLKCKITIDSQSVNPKHPATVSVTVENMSGREFDLKAVYIFELLNVSAQAKARDYSGLGDSYWSPLDISSGESLRLPVKGPVPKMPLHLKRDEAKSFRFDLAKLLWNATTRSIWPRENLFNVLPKGSYWLIFKVSGNRETTSNKIEVVVE